MRGYHILDTTLRDGEQTAGIVFSNEEKVRIAMELDNAGVDIIEAGIPVMGREEKEVLSRINKLDLNAEVLSWNRMKKKDIKESLDCGINNIHISAPVSDLHINRKLNKTRKWVLNKIDCLIKFAVEQGCTVSVGAEDASRAEMSFLIKFYRTAVEAGVERIRFADTVGALDPFSTAEKIRQIKDEISVVLDFHGHNDLGMATANALAAVREGAECVSCTVNGLGERAGNTPLEEIVVALQCLYNYKGNVDVKKLFSLSRLVGGCSGRQVPEDKPLVGDKVFSHEAGIHVDGLLKDSKIYELISPALLGRNRDLVLGKHSCVSAVKHVLEEKGVNVDDREAKKILEKLRKREA